MHKISEKRSEEGFTLIELLVVIVILGILSAVVVFAVGGISDKGDKSACKSDYKSVETAQEAHYAKSSPSTYASSVGALVTAKLIRSAPTSSKYSIATDSTGAVTATVGSTTGGIATCDTIT